MPVGYTSQRSVQVSGFTDICLLPRCAASYPLPVRQASALPSASSGFAVARDTLAVRLTLLLAECVEDFHLQVRAPCRAHQQKTRSARRRTGFVCPARYLQAEANLALAAFIGRPQAEAQIGALKFYQSASRSIEGVQYVSGLSHGGRAARAAM